ncbi:MAG: PH domain-containing protein [Bacteroidota bacterium]
MRTPLQKDEKVLLVTHTSWTSMILPAFIMLAAIVGSFFIGFFIHYGWILAVLGIIVFVVKYFQWQAYTWVVTNQRVIDETGLFSHFAKESPLEKINNVSYNQNFLGHIFNYGNVEIQTAAQVGATVYDKVNNPKRLKETVTQAQTDFENQKGMRQATQIATAMGLANKNTSSSHSMTAELEKLFELKQKGVLSDEEYIKAKNKLIG